MTRPNPTDIRIQRARDGILAIVGPLTPLERMTTLHLALASALTHQADHTGLSVESCLHGLRASVEFHLQAGRVVPLDPKDCQQSPPPPPPPPTSPPVPPLEML